MTVAVTGGSGRLGNVLVRALLESGERVRVLEPGDGPVRSLEGLEVEILRGSVLDHDALDALCEDVDVLFHLAAKVSLGDDRDGSIFAVNVGGTERVIEACLERRLRLVHCSSHHALVRHPLHLPLDEQKPLALEEACDYHRAKAQAERRVLDAVADRHLDAVICSPGTLVGPHDYEPSMLARALLGLYHGQLKALLQVVSDYVDVRDVASAMIAAVTRGRRGERYLLTGEVLTMRALADALEPLIGRPMPRVNLPLWAGWALVPGALLAGRLMGREPLLSPGVLRAAVSNHVVLHDKATRELGFSPRSVRASLEGAFAWYDERGWLDAPPTLA